MRNVLDVKRSRIRRKDQIHRPAFVFNGLPGRTNELTRGNKITAGSAANLLIGNSCLARCDERTDERKNETDRFMRHDSSIPPALNSRKIRRGRRRCHFLQEMPPVAYICTPM